MKGFSQVVYDKKKKRIGGEFERVHRGCKCGELLLREGHKLCQKE